MRRTDRIILRDSHLQR